MAIARVRQQVSVMQRFLSFGDRFNLYPNRLEKNCLVLIFPLALLVLAVFVEYAGVDLWLSAHFYDPRGHVWPLKHHWLTSGVLHVGGQYLDKAVGLAWFVVFVSSFYNQQVQPFRKVLVFFFCAAGAGPLVVGLLKHLTHIYTPWDLQIFHGSHPYIRLFDPVPTGATIGSAFPAGHASGGYAFMCLYFVLLRSKPAYRFHGLFLGVVLGFIYGVGQQLRGAHFFSHDIFSLVICWYASLAVYLIFYFHGNPFISPYVGWRNFINLQAQVSSRNRVSDEKKQKSG